MCNLNILICKEKFKEDFKIAQAFMQSVTSASYLFNDYADGVYFNNVNKLYRDSNKINLLQYDHEFKKSNIIITHQRLATHGLNTESNQPFLNEGFVFAHNGVLFDYAKIDTNKSDSLNMFNHFLELFKEKIKDNKNSRELIIMECIKQCINDKTGSFSIILFDIKTQIMYYFKNSMTDINFYRGKVTLFITTKQDNKSFLSLLDDGFNKIKVKNNSIYKIYIDNEIRVNKIGKIKHTTYFETPAIDKTNLLRKSDHSPFLHKQNYNDYGFNDLDYNGHDIGKIEKSQEVNLNSSMDKCFFCKSDTYGYDPEFKRIICPSCYNKTNGNYPKYV